MGEDNHTKVISSKVSGVDTESSKELEDLAKAGGFKWAAVLAPVLFVVLLILSAIVFGIDNLLQFIGIN
ncbi:hypothetical protein A2982_04290 [candidate division WWE3 bacterium RIFCSPLOWO2_01_FULL_39_13]|uniref:Uncharacterized protein n=1 Tax=candidate division WWE3 bacterium RIFCSPLOWO2_01_FULL_39_13 TaxID=1802624 RepID=A0A1F4V255_UNCKA|nr:MAG: hypothetical protein A2982_04290 [candidate division WWE3 bacterium RIFCSPLOWO2_01_FULL_39_13]